MRSNRPWLLETGDENRQTYGGLISPFEGNPPAFAPDQYQSEGDNPDEQREPAPGRNFVNVGGDEGKMSRRNAPATGKTKAGGQRHRPQATAVTSTVVTVMSPATAIP